MISKKYLNLPEHIVEIYGQIPRCSILIKDETFIKIYESNDNFVNNVCYLLNEANKTTFTFTYYSQKFMKFSSKILRDNIANPDPDKLKPSEDAVPPVSPKMVKYQASDNVK